MPAGSLRARTGPARQPPARAGAQRGRPPLGARPAATSSRDSSGRSQIRAPASGRPVEAVEHDTDHARWSEQLPVRLETPNGIRESEASDETTPPNSSYQSGCCGRRACGRRRSAASGAATRSRSTARPRRARTAPVHRADLRRARRRRIGIVHVREVQEIEARRTPNRPTACRQCHSRCVGQAGAKPQAEQSLSQLPRRGCS